jgi:sugar lactone lactonase YvrE
VKPEIIADYGCDTGENPLWHPDEQRLYWVDIPRGRLFRYDPSTGRHEMCFEGEALGGFTVQADGSLLLFMARGTVKKWRGGKFKTVIEDIPEERDSRFNDVIADPEGRVFCGTMSSPSHKGRLYRLDTDGSLRVVVHDVGCSNGMGFTLDRKQMYYTDSRERTIYLFDYDRASGAISNRRVFMRVTEGEGGPDGMTVDSQGFIWSAFWGGSCLVRFDPNGREVQRIMFPARKVSSVTFGGSNYEDIYVTTALAGGTKESEGAGAGALFRLRAGVRGLPEFRSRIGL